MKFSESAIAAVQQIQNHGEPKMAFETRPFYSLADFGELLLEFPDYPKRESEFLLEEVW